MTFAPSHPFAVLDDKGKLAPVGIHPNIEAAQIEAEAMAWERPGTPVFVMRVERRVVVPRGATIVTRYDIDEDEHG